MLQSGPKVPCGILVMARGWSADMEIKKCINSVWRERVGQKRMKALWFGGAVSAGTGLWSHWFMAESEGPIIEVMWEQEAARVRLLSNAEPALQSHFKRENESVEFTAHRSLCQNYDAGSHRPRCVCACVEGAAHVFLENKSQNTHVVPVVWLLVLRVFVTVIF